MLSILRATTVAFAGLALMPALARAHSTADPSEGTGGGYLRTAFHVTHGCKSSAMTAVTIRISEGVLSAKPMSKAGWTIETKTLPLDTPVESDHGFKIREAVLDRLAAAIERERDYPLHSRRQGHQGRVVIHLAIAASGKLLAAQVVTGSGLDTLDRAALGMVQRARLPPLSPGFGAESATFTVPIVFAIR